MRLIRWKLEKIVLQQNHKVLLYFSAFASHLSFSLLLFSRDSRAMSLTSLDKPKEID